MNVNALKQQLKRHLQDRREQLRALILVLEDRGNSHPQYNQLNNLKSEYELVINQLQKLNK